MKKATIYILLLSIFFYSCANKYQTYISNYPFKSTSNSPDYNLLDYWAAHPWKWDPSDSIAKPLLKEQRDSTVDVFFLHPTTFTDKEKTGEGNARIDDEYINAKTDYSSILYQASVFNQRCRVYAPRYRQAHIQNFYSTDTAAAKKAFALAYEDVKNAFVYYMQQWNNGRPIIIAAHSQGSMLANMLLKEYFDTSSSSVSLKNKLVVAYIIGWPVPKNYFSSLKVCEDSLQTGCLCSWRTYRNGFVPPYIKKENREVYITNPLSWATTDEFVSRKKNNGSLLTKFNKIYKRTTDAQIDNGLLYTYKPSFPWSFLLKTKNYHVGDINLYYMNIRENVKQRINSYWKSK